MRHQQNPFGQKRNGPDIKNPSGQERLKQAGPPRRIASAEFWSQVMQCQNWNAEDQALCEAIFVLANALRKRPIKNRLNGEVPCQIRPLNPEPRTLIPPNEPPDRPGLA